MESGVNDYGYGGHKGKWESGAGRLVKPQRGGVIGLPIQNQLVL